MAARRKAAPAAKKAPAPKPGRGKAKAKPTHRRPAAQRLVDALPPTPPPAPEKKRAARKRSRAAVNATISATTLWDESMVQRVLAYDKRCEETGDVPLIEELALELGISPRTLQDWERIEGREMFCAAVNRVRTRQASVLLRGGLMGQFKSAIVGLMLMNNHGYKAKSELTGKDGAPLGQAPKEIPDDATPEQAHDIYSQMLEQGGG